MRNYNYDYDALLDRIAALEEANYRLSVSSSFGCLTRNGLIEALRSIDIAGKAIVYFDVDNLKRANETWGKLESSRRIRQATTIRHGDDLLIGQWFSGDEFVAILPADDAYGYACRVQHSLMDSSMSATFIITPIGSDDLHAQIDRAEVAVSALKASGLRACITILS